MLGMAFMFSDLGAGQGEEWREQDENGLRLLSQKFSGKQAPQPPLPGLPSFPLVWAPGQIPHHLHPVSLGQNGRKLPSTPQARRKVRRQRCFLRVTHYSLSATWCSMEYFVHFTDAN